MPDQASLRAQARAAAKTDALNNPKNGETTMDAATRRQIIDRKLAEEHLPRDPFSRIWGGIGNGEVCDACNEAVARGTLMMEGLSSKGASLEFHVECFYLWQAGARAQQTQSKNG